VVFAEIGPLATIIDMPIVGIRVPFAGSFRVPFIMPVTSSIVKYILTLVGVYVLALIINGLVPTFSGRKNINQALKVAAYSHTPGWMVGIHPVHPFPESQGILGRSIP